LNINNNNNEPIDYMRWALTYKTKINIRSEYNWWILFCFDAVLFFAQLSYYKLSKSYGIKICRINAIKEEKQHDSIELKISVLRFHGLLWVWTLKFLNIKQSCK